MAAINPYLVFRGECEEAFNFYRSVFGGEFTSIMRNKDLPPEFSLPADESENIMHMELPIGNGGLLMGSDRPVSFGPATKGDNFTISIIADTEKEADRLFSGLSAGGKVTMPLARSFWNSYFGMFTDKFGFSWMVNYYYKNPVN